MSEHTNEKASVLDYPLSVKVADRIQAQQYRCWYNACKAITHLPGLFLLATYTEGWLVVPKEQEIQVIEHGWITGADTRVVDPSIVLLEEHGQDLVYFPALHFPWPQVQALPEDIPLPLAHLLSPTESEIGHPEYRKAYDAALTYAEHLATASGKPVRLCPAETAVAVVTKEGTYIIMY